MKNRFNSIQLMQAEGEWKIASIVWHDETEENPIPELYLRLDLVEGL